MDTAQVALLVGIATGAIGLLAAGVSTVRKVRAWWRPKSERIDLALDTLGGRPAIADPAGGGRLPAILPLHERLLTIEATQRDQAAALRAIAEVNTALAELHRITSDHEVRLVSLEDVEAERSLSREESTAMWRAVADREVIDVEGTEQ